jgi:hypothetical protein
MEEMKEEEKEDGGGYLQKEINKLINLAIWVEEKGR